jgi:hypothetical protein
MLRAANSDILYPELIATRAYALAATARPAEAQAEMSLVAKECPAYVFQGRAQFRVALLAAVAAGDLGRARELAGSRTQELPLSLRDEMLVDLAVAATTTLSKDERARIDGELADDGELRAWIDIAAPGLRDRARAAACPVRVNADADVADPVGVLDANGEVEDEAGRLQRLARQG